MPQRGVSLRCPRVDGFMMLAMLRAWSSRACPMLDGMTDPMPSVVEAPQVLARIASALPDAISAAFFLMVWLMPLRFGADMVSTAMLVMLIEFITVHASGVLGGVVLDP